MVSGSNTGPRDFERIMLKIIFNNNDINSDIYLFNRVAFAAIIFC